MGHPSHPIHVDEPGATMPFYGWRQAGLLGRIEGGQIVEIAFESMNQPDIFGLQAGAHCRSHPHEPPAEHCKCGFYALDDKKRILRGDYAGHVPRPHNVVLAVALYGTVIQGTRGWRASRQRVRRIEVANRCAHPRCGGEVVAVAVGEVAAINTAGKWMRLVPVCAEHTRTSSHPKRPSGKDEKLGPAGLADLEAVAGVEVKVQSTDERSAGVGAATLQAAVRADTPNIFLYAAVALWAMLRGVGSLASYGWGEAASIWLTGAAPIIVMAAVRSAAARRRAYHTVSWLSVLALVGLAGLVSGLWAHIVASEGGFVWSQAAWATLAMYVAGVVFVSTELKAEVVNKGPLAGVRFSAIFGVGTLLVGVVLVALAGSG